MNMEFDEKEELRDGFLVDSKRKKIWQTELNILRQFDICCKEYNLKYFVEYGTLLGAVRHKGFIPWDDDVDVVMMRDDYNKLKKIGPKFFTYPLFYQNVYTNPHVMWEFSKIRDDRTSAIEWKTLGKDFHQGIFIDIFPMDDIPDGKEYKKEHFEIVVELWHCCENPTDYAKKIENGEVTFLDKKTLFTILQMPAVERFRVFEEAISEMNGKSELCNYFGQAIFGLHNERKKSWYDEIVYLPFEDMMVPAPKNYEEILKAQYGDYLKPKRGTSLHENAIMDPYRPYTYYLE